MRKLVKQNNLVNFNEIEGSSSNALQHLRRTVLVPWCYKPNILRALNTINFQFHRTCSYANIIRDCNVSEGETLLMFWGYGRSESKLSTISMSASSCSSVHISPNNQNAQRDRDLRSTAQQTDISCRQSPVNISDVDEHRVMVARIADSLTFPSPASPASPASSVVHPGPGAGAGAGGRSMSILGSVCALLLNKQGSAVPKAVASITGSNRSENICRICFGGESAERLVRPCSCRGTIAAVHRTCLERWLLQAATSHCELCRHHYDVTRSHKWSWMSSLAAWAWWGGGRALAADVWRGAALCAGSVLGTARALHACDAALAAGARRGGGAALAANIFSSLLIGIIGALNGLLTTWILLKIQEHQLSWQAWRDSTLHVHVTLVDDDVTVTPRPSDATVVGVSPTTEDGNTTTDRSTNVADPFMVAIPYRLPEP